MPNYKKSKFYKNSSKYASNYMESALNKDKRETVNTSTEIGSVIGKGIGGFFGGGAASIGDAIGYLLGYGVGTVINLAGGSYEDNRDIAENDLMSFRNKLYGSAENAMRDRNQNLSSLKRLGGELKQQFDYNYGTGLFDELQSAISQILNLSDGKTISNTLSQLSLDNVVGELANRLVYNEKGVFDNNAAFSTQDYKSILEKYVSLEDLGSEYSRFIIEKAQQGGIAQKEFDNLSTELQQSEEDYLKQMNDLSTEYSKMYSDAFFSKVDKDIDSAISQGASEANSSGFKVKGASAQTKLQKVKSDIAKVAYYSTLDYYRNSLISKVESNQISRARTYYAYQRQVISLEDKLESNITESLNNYLYGIGEGLKKAEKLEEEEATSMSGAIAYNEEIGKYRESNKEVYDVERLTGN